MSSSKNIELLLENKREYIAHINDILTSNYIKELLKLYDTVIKKDTVLKDFQNLLSKITEYNHIQIDELYQNIIQQNEYGYFPELLKATVTTIVNINMIMHETENIKIKIRIPTPQNFIHSLFVAIARALWKKPYLLYHKVRTIERQYNINQLEKIIHNAILYSIRSIIPMDKIVRSFTTDVEEESAPVEVTPVTPVVPPIEVTPVVPQVEVTPVVPPVVSVEPIDVATSTASDFTFDVPAQVQEIENTSFEPLSLSSSSHSQIEELLNNQDHMIKESQKQEDGAGENHEDDDGVNDDDEDDDDEDDEDDDDDEDDEDEDDEDEYDDDEDDEDDDDEDDDDDDDEEGEDAEDEIEQIKEDVPVTPPPVGKDVKVVEIISKKPNEDYYEEIEINNEEDEIEKDRLADELALRLFKMKNPHLSTATEKKKKKKKDRGERQRVNESFF